MKHDLITCDKETLSGTPVFAGTRVAVRALIDYLAGDHTLSEFLDDFPTVSREQAVELLEKAEAPLLTQVNEATH